VPVCRKNAAKASGAFIPFIILAHFVTLFIILQDGFLLFDTMASCHLGNLSISVSAARAMMTTTPASGLQ